MSKLMSSAISFRETKSIMDGKVCTFIKEKSHYLMTIFIVLQGLVFLFTSIMLFVSRKDIAEDISFDIFMTLILFLFYGYMVHFAYHSIAKAYYLELIAFLIMSTTSSVLSVIAIFYLSVSEGGDEYASAYVIGIISCVILILGNIIYFFTAYFSYDYFEEKFIEKLGAKLKYHKMFYWVQFSNSMMKSDFGFFLMILFADYIFDYRHYWFIIVDTLLGGLLLFLMILLRRAIRNELRNRVIFVSVIKIIVFGYMIFRIYQFFRQTQDLENNPDIEQVKVPARVSLIIYLIINAIHIILIIVSNFKCLSFFENGLKEALLSQNSKTFVKNDEEEEQI